MASKGQAAAGPVFSDRMLRTTTASCAGARAVAVACTTRVGTRKSQEDRLVVSEDFHGHTVLAVFDGTVGDYASDFCQKHFLDHLAASKSFQQLCEAMRADEVREVPAAVPAAVAPLAGHALKEALAATDAALLAACARLNNDYASSTAVVVMVTRSLVTVAHLGDSRVAVGKSGQTAAFVTEDHKADSPGERRRIESKGGSVVFLHQGKPFIRGGDFARRQAQGDRPMQLNYSRAVSTSACCVLWWSVVLVCWSGNLPVGWCFSWLVVAWCHGVACFCSVFCASFHSPITAERFLIIRRVCGAADIFFWLSCVFCL